MRRISTLSSLLAAATVALAASVGSVGVARADEFVDKANALIGKIPDARRSDLVMLPLIAKMDQEPQAFVGTDNAILYDNTSPGWAGYLEWANKPAQRAVLAGLAKVTENTKYQQRMVFALPYGVEGVPTDLVMQGMYIELGDPPTLAAAKFEFDDRVGWVADLIAVETNRLVAEGKPADALKVLVNGLYMGRQLADRESGREKSHGMSMMKDMLELIRDVAYRDSRSGAPKLTPEDLIGTIKAIGERDLLSIERITFPQFDRIAAEQLASKIFGPGGKVNVQVFATTMARVASGDRPLRLFSEAGRWEQLAARHKGATDTKTMIANIDNDLVKRWSLDEFDPYMSRPSDLMRAGRSRLEYSSLIPIFRPLLLLFQERQQLRAEAAATRVSLGVQAFVLRNKALPPDFSAIRPAFVQEIETDPYLPNKKRLAFFVPIRDENGGPDAGPHEIRLFQMPDHPNFSVKLGSDQFVIYSAGPDQTAEWVKDATQADPEYKAGDYLLWPPRYSLLRQYMSEQGLLK